MSDSVSAASGTAPLATRVHHYGYTVPDLEKAIHNAVAMYGIGPFLMIENVPLEDVTSRGEPAAFAHSTAFAQWGDIRIELSQIHQCAPARVRDAFAASGPGVNHVAWTVSSLVQAGERLEDAGAPSFVSASLGDISFVFHDSSAVWGHNVELHLDSPAFHGFFEQIRDMSVDWDGRDPIRSPVF
jgi:glyoxalase/bleomycin resistance protein/dioxygenase superfamily protein